MDAGPKQNKSVAVEPSPGSVPAPPSAKKATPSRQNGSEVKAAAAQRGSACHSQDGESVPLNRLRAIGTEPFWGATIDGRCVTYSHPDDQSGTRVWTRFEGSAEAGEWKGAYDGKPFVLRTRQQAGCSDGMSDRRYPLAVTLSIGGEERQGCAAPV